MPYCPAGFTPVAPAEPPLPRNRWLDALWEPEHEKERRHEAGVQEAADSSS